MRVVSVGFVLTVDRAIGHWRERNTINRTEHDQDFVDSIRQFVNDWKAGLETNW